VLIPAAVVLVLTILLLTFKRFSDIAASLAVVGLSALWAVGIMGLTGLKFTMIHVALIPLVLGLGIDYSIHMLNRYHEELRKGSAPLKAASSSMKTTGVAVVLAAVTTIIGFGSFMASELPAIGTLGIFAALGIGFSFLLSTCFLPALLVLRGGRHIGRREMERGRIVDRALGKAAGASESYGKFIIAAAVLVTVACGLMASDIRTEMSFKTFLPSDVPSMVALDHLSEEFGGRYVMVVLVHGDYMDPKALQEMLSVENAAVGKNEIITGSYSLASTVKEIVKQVYGNVSLEDLTREQIEMIVSGMDNKELSRLVKDNTAVIYFYVDAKSDKEMASASRTVRETIENMAIRQIDMYVDGKPAVGGIPVIIGDISESISGGMMRTTILAMLLCLIVVAVAFRSIVLGGITLIPLLLTTVWEFGAIKSMGWAMDILTMGISSLVIGVGIDYGIHMVHRFLEERRKGGERIGHIHTTVTHVGRALVAAAATTIGVFGILAMSRMPALMRFGTLTALLILFAFISAILILPSIIALWAKRSEKRGF
ncbi:MAG: MMPL family transporter, partial [Candidatus Hadarchaeales archaeon]